MIFTLFVILNLLQTMDTDKYIDVAVYKGKGKILRRL